LLCKGRGADKDSYRPRSDESQWWGRRDALVRCVASFLFGANTKRGENIPPAATARTKKELVLLFDEDFARLHMTLDANGDVHSGDEDNVNVNVNDIDYAHIFPKEQTIIQLWKRAAQNLRKPVEYQGMKCIIHLDPALSLRPQKETGGSSSGSINNSNIERIDTKRAVLEYIQKNVSIEFLRENKINSHPEVVLRKTNRKALLKIWDTWTKHQHTSLDSEGENEDYNNDNNSQNGRRLRTIYHELLQFPPEKTFRNSYSSSDSKNVSKVVAGTLHESCEEFPCFGFNQLNEEREQEESKESATHVSYRVCLFLGAVRDMTSQEKEILGRVCEASKIPLVGVRFGTVPEFTSKILSLLAFHHANQVLGVSIKRLLVAAVTNEKPYHSRSITIQQQQQQSTYLNIICTVPTYSKEISIDMNKRDEIHWRLVRVIVCSLWRSKLVSSKSRVSHTNVLHLVFDDGVIVSLKEREFVERLASQHQAAPSEYQILTALIQEIDHQSQLQPPLVASTKQCSGGIHPVWSRKKLAKRLVKEVVKSSPIPITCAIGIESSSTNEIVSHFYDHTTTGTIHTAFEEDSDHSLMMAIDIAVSPNQSKGYVFNRREQKQDKAKQQYNCEPRKIFRELLSASRKLQIPTIEQNIVPGHCWDREAASIIAVQHMCYQNRVFVSQWFQSRKAMPPKITGKKRKKSS